MIKLTRERIYEIAGGNRSTYEIALAIEAEVLRINGITDHSADVGKMVTSKPIQSAPYDRCQKHLREAGKAYPRTCSVCGLWGPCQFEPQANTAPRATGCPDTMDDTARFAADELPAILRKQAG